LYLPWRGPISQAEDERDHAALHVHDRGAGEVDVAVAEAREVGAELASQPPPQTQLPNSGYMIGADDAAVDHEGGEFPPLGRATGRDGRRGVHEHHLEQEQREGGRVIAGALEKEALPAEDAERLAEDRPW
jgi:hypothetical protein